MRGRTYLGVAALDERGTRGDVVDVHRGVHLLDLRIERPDARVRVDRHGGEVHTNTLSAVGRIHHELVDEAGRVLSVARLQPVATPNLAGDESDKLIAIKGTPYGGITALNLGEVGLRTNRGEGIRVRGWVGTLGLGYVGVRVEVSS